MGKSTENIDVDFDQLVKIFNENGKEAAEEFVATEYNSSYPFIQRKLRKESNYFFNKRTRKYEIKTNDQAHFMTIEELCQEKAKANDYVEKQSPQMDSANLANDNFKSLMLYLMKDKMQELNKYIYLEQSTNQVIINLKKLKANGYNVVIN